MYLYLESVTKFQKFSNNMAGTEGNLVSMQKERHLDGDYTVTSHPCLGFAARQLLETVVGSARVERTWNQASRKHEWRDAKNPLDRTLFGKMVPEASSDGDVSEDGEVTFELAAPAATVEITFSPKEKKKKKGGFKVVLDDPDFLTVGWHTYTWADHQEGVDFKAVVQAFDADKKKVVLVKHKGTCESQRAAMSLYRAISLTQFGGEMEHHFAAAGAQNSDNPTPYSREYHYTAMQYLLSLNLAEVTASDAEVVLYVASHLQRVGGGNTQNLVDWTPESVVGHVSDSGCSQIQDAFGCGGEDNVNISYLISAITRGDFDHPENLVIGGRVVEGISPDNKVLLEKVGVALFTSRKDALAELSARVKKAY
jgi:hypothetical protein